ncbi:MAG: hypothetical protein ACK5UR_07145 [Armatimonadota bacterium]|nr:hypothetical protein [Fimbriimonadaceae bacterium]MCZ8139708.1 hypothetical protein [Fimbriimonadaceae bacterium]
MNWIPLTTQAELDALLLRFGNFHDGCIREAHVWTETYVMENMHMRVPHHMDNRVRLLVHRQWRDPSAIELLFEEVTTFHLVPPPENYAGIIMVATLLLEGEIFYWADDAPWHPSAPNRDQSTWIGARKLSWRDASDWMGPELRYGGGGGASPPAGVGV